MFSFHKCNEIAIKGMFQAFYYKGVQTITKTPYDIDWFHK